MHLAGWGYMLSPCVYYNLYAKYSRQIFLNSACDRPIFLQEILAGAELLLRCIPGKFTLEHLNQLRDDSVLLWPKKADNSSSKNGLGEAWVSLKQGPIL